MISDKEVSENIKAMLSIEEVTSLLEELGAEPRIRGHDTIVCKTICHNHPYEGSHKLYCYFNNETFIFHCYTSCGESFDLFELIIKIKEISGEDWSLPRAVNYVIEYFNLPIVEKEESELSADLGWSLLKSYGTTREENEQLVELNKYNPKILKHLPRPRILDWEDEGITKEVMHHAGIAYDPVGRGIVIPHFSAEGDLVGVRARTLIEELEDFGKYKPIILNGNMYNHPLGFNLYNLNNSKGNIRLIQKAIVFESEKSCLLYQSLFGIENDISVAVCGSNISSYQVQLLKDLGAKEIIIAFDKQYKDLKDEGCRPWVEKLKRIHQKYGAYIQISFMFDKEDILGYKDSPIDCGKEKFETLFRNRVMI